MKEETFLMTSVTCVYQRVVLVLPPQACPLGWMRMPAVLSGMMERHQRMGRWTCGRWGGAHSTPPLPLLVYSIQPRIGPPPGTGLRWGVQSYSYSDHHDCLPSPSGRSCMADLF